MQQHLDRESSFFPRDETHPFQSETSWHGDCCSLGDFHDGRTLLQVQNGRAQKSIEIERAASEQEPSMGPEL